MNRVLKLVPFFLLSSIVAMPLQASWIEDGVAICAATGEQWEPQIIPDGAGGAIITWYDFRFGNYKGIYAQRVDASGSVQWIADGVAVCVAAGTQLDPQMVSDGGGGAIVAWWDDRNGVDCDIYAQRVDASGDIRWPADGVAICTATDDQAVLRIVSDGDGGAIIVWDDRRSGEWHVFAQRVNASGEALWATNGVSVCPRPTKQLEPRIISDGTGGAIIAWEDKPSGDYTDVYTDIYAQRVNASGIVQWMANGIGISTAPMGQIHMEIDSDGIGGAIVTWADQRNGYSDINIYAQRVDASGTVQWAPNGVPVSVAFRNQEHPAIVCDASGSAIIAWQDLRNGDTADIYAQRLNASGSLQWIGTGVAICTATLDQDEPKITTDGAAGAIITWRDDRDATIGDADIYARRVDASGSVRWTANGVPICRASDDQAWHQISSDEAGGAIITWQDNRSGSKDIYAQSIDQYGRPGGTLTGVSGSESSCIAYVAQNYPNPFNSWTRISFGLTESSVVSLRIYDCAGRLVRVLVDGPRHEGDFEEAWDGRGETGKRVSTGIYFYRLEVGRNSQTRKIVLLR